jgi:hypothetical protein
MIAIGKREENWKGVRVKNGGRQGKARQADDGYDI